MTNCILFVDDEERILASMERTLRRQFTLETALGPEVALSKVGASPYAVIVSDMRMPGMDGLSLLRKVHDIRPDAILMMLTGNADLRTAIDAVNEGAIFRFLEKPCPGDTLIKVLLTALEQYHLRASEKELLQKTLHGSIKMLTDVLGLVNPEAFSMAARTTTFVKQVVAQLGLKESWRFEMAAMLSRLGCVVVPTDTLEAVRLGRQLTSEQQQRYASHPAVARDLLRNIPRLESIAEMIGRQLEPFRTQRKAPLAERDEETLGAQILRVCVQFEVLMRTSENPAAALRALRDQPGEYDPALVDLLNAFSVGTPSAERRTIHMADLRTRMVLDEDLRTKEGTLLVPKGNEVTETLLTRINNFRVRGSVSDSIKVVIPAQAS
jgi:response regulator RpfG family c-di-GMP phosphodiesterase